MAQFDVHRNTGRRTARAFPFLVVIQSSLFNDNDYRVVIPLALADLLTEPVDDFLCPKFAVDGADVVLYPLGITNIRYRLLGEKIASLQAEGDRIVAAMDWMMSRAYG